MYKQQSVPSSQTHRNSISITLPNFTIRISPQGPDLRNDLLDPALLELLDLGLEILHLLPAVKRPSVVLPQASNHRAAGALDGLGERADLLARLELGAHLLNLLADGVVAGGGDILVVVGGDLLVGGLEGVGFLLLELLELFSYAFLDLELNELAAGGIGLRERLN